jgi:hypothetical protein
MGKDLSNLIDNYDEGDYDKEDVKILIKFATLYKVSWRWDTGGVNSPRKVYIQDMLDLWKLNKFNKTG